MKKGDELRKINKHYLDKLGDFMKSTDISLHGMFGEFFVKEGTTVNK